jgi:hypothetical protein
MTNRVWVGKRSFEIERINIAEDEGQYVLDVECDGTTVSLCLNEATWDTLVDAAAEITFPERSFLDDPFLDDSMDAEDEQYD